VPIARHIVTSGSDAAAVGRFLTEELRADDLRLALVFADWRLDPGILAATLHRGLAPATTVGCTTVGVIGHAVGAVPGATAIGLYGDWIRAGVGVARELSKSALMRSRDAVHQAVAALGTTVDALDPSRHVALTLVDGRCGHEEAFCIGSAAAAPRIRFVGGSAGVDIATTHRPFVWVDGEVFGDAGAVIVLDSQLPFYPITSSHLVATDVRAVVTAASGRVISELDGQPAVPRLHELIDLLVAAGGEELDDARPSQYSFGRFVDGLPYVRSMIQLDAPVIHLATAVEVGHVLRVMRPVDLIGTTRRDLAAVSDRLGGGMSALIAFSCMGRHWEAAAKGLEGELAAAYAAHPTIGFQSLGEQSGMMQVNHTLTGLAIGKG
jgi:hypothetical protein